MFMKRANDFVTTDFAIIITICAPNGGARLLSYAAYLMKHLLHRFFRSCCSDVVGTTTIVVPYSDPRAGNMNIKLFPLPVRMITKTRLLPSSTIAYSASRYTLRNCAAKSLNISLNCFSTSMPRILY
jgi:hypothetical protein